MRTLATVLLCLGFALLVSNQGLARLRPAQPWPRIRLLACTPGPPGRIHVHALATAAAPPASAPAHRPAGIARHAVHPRRCIMPGPPGAARHARPIRSGTQTPVTPAAHYARRSARRCTSPRSSRWPTPTAAGEALTSARPCASTSASGTQCGGLDQPTPALLKAITGRSPRPESLARLVTRPATERCTGAQSCCIAASRAHAHWPMTTGLYPGPTSTSLPPHHGTHSPSCTPCAPCSPLQARCSPYSSPAHAAPQMAGEFMLDYSVGYDIKGYGDIITDAAAFAAANGDNPLAARRSPALATSPPSREALTSARHLSS